MYHIYFNCLDKNKDDKESDKVDKPLEGASASAVDSSEGPENLSMTREVSNDGDGSHVVIDDTEKDAGWFSTLGMTTLTGAVKHTVQQTSSLVQEKVQKTSTLVQEKVNMSLNNNI